MPPIGFSTGAVEKKEVAEGVRISAALGLHVIELSALRTVELAPLTAFVSRTDLSAFGFVSLHAPTDYSQEQEPWVASTLSALSIARGWPVVVHPDCIHDDELWIGLGQLLFIENMDKRKSIGRTVTELAGIFDRFPLARLCFDIAHAHQVDTSMTEAYRILRTFGNRVGQVHMSEVTSSSKHDRMSNIAISAFREVASLLSQSAPVILETPVTLAQAAAELERAASVFETVARRVPA